MYRPGSRHNPWLNIVHLNLGCKFELHYARGVKAPSLYEGLSLSPIFWRSVNNSFGCTYTIASCCVSVYIQTKLCTVSSIPPNAPLPSAVQIFPQHCRHLDQTPTPPIASRSHSPCPGASPRTHPLPTPVYPVQNCMLCIGLYSNPVGLHRQLEVAGLKLDIRSALDRVPA